MSDDKIIELDKHRPHLGGTLRCLTCKYEWEGVAPIGTLGLECPECGLYQGYWLNPIIPKMVYQCVVCKGALWFACIDHTMQCASCGVRIEYPCEDTEKKNGK